MTVDKKVVSSGFAEAVVVGGLHSLPYEARQRPLPALTRGNVS